MQGEITEIKNQYIRKGRSLQKAKLADATGIVEITWFNQPYITKTLVKGSRVSVSGRVGDFRFQLNKKTIESPDYEMLSGNQKPIHTGRLVPVYPETRGVSSKWLRRQVYTLLNNSLDQIAEHLPQALLNKLKLNDLTTSIQHIHFPASYEQSIKARERLAFDELFLMQLSALKRRREWKKKKVSHILQIALFQKEINKLIASLPFSLTNSQEKALADILQDLSSDQPMNRLLEGDVGSGKTVVSAIAMYATFLNGFQSILLAPTEILAGQHYNTIKNLLSPLRVRVNLITGSKKLPPTPYTLPPTDILIGTHAILSEKISLEKLALVVIDEQQRFGVTQRAIIRKKGENPHLLTMTATPIPRTMALARYGDLDVSYLLDMPKGRQLIRTWLVGDEKRDSAYQWIEKQLKTTNSQAFIICPFIEESENMVTVKAATVEFQRLKKEVFPNLRLGLLHGKLKAKEKDEVLTDFRNKKFDILVATPVVEVGIDIPNATIMVIEGTERFGLSQLHQLRGRVGRGEKKSYCLMFTQSQNDMTKRRLKAMETTHVGSQLAELDLQLRGPGELYGTRQHGSAFLKIATFSDYDLIQKAHTQAQEFINQLDQFPALAEKVHSASVNQVNPD